MKNSVTTAIVICPTESSVKRRLLGLTVGERLLLSLAAAGVERVAFIGDGPRPTSARARIRVVSANEVANSGLAGGVLVLPADLVFDRGLASQVEGVPLLPLVRLDAGWRDVDARDWLERLGRGRAESGRGFAIRVTDNASHRQAERALLLSLRKPIDGFVSRHLNRYVSTTVTRWLVRTPVTPNQCTLAFMLLGIAAAVFAAISGPWWTLLLAGGAFQLQSILDGCDGEIARLTYRFSRRGQWLDTIGDDLSNYLFTLGLSIGIAHTRDWTWLYALGGLTFVVQWAASGIMYRRMILWGTGDLLAIPDTVTPSEGDGVREKLMRLARILSKRDTFVLITAALTAAQLPLVALLVIGGGTYPTFVGVLVNDRRVARLPRPAHGTI